MTKEWEQKILVEQPSWDGELLSLKQEIAKLYIEKLKKEGKVAWMASLLDGTIEDFLLSEDQDILDKIGSALKVKFWGQVLGLKEEVISEITEMKAQLWSSETDLDTLKSSIVETGDQTAFSTPVSTTSMISSSSTSLTTTSTIVAPVVASVEQSWASSKRYEQLKWPEKPDPKVFDFALQWYEKLRNDLRNSDYLTIVDYTKSRDEDRMFVINMKTNTVEYLVPVGHGKKSGGKFATSFSNGVGSNKSSLGFYRTPEAIRKSRTKKWSGLLLSWIEESNRQAKQRGIYIHPGTVEGSEWCFTLPKEATEIMNKLKGDSLLFAYYPDSNYLAQSDLISDDSSIRTAA